MTEESNEGAMDAARAALKEHFGYDGFRPGQETLVGAVLTGRDCLGVMPTGAGKSICYQIPGVVLPGLTPVSYTHLDVYKRQALRLRAVAC